MTALITLLIAGSDTGPFDLYSIDALGIVFNTPFATNISKSVLISGYTATNVPNDAVKVRVVSKSQNCSNYIDIKLV